MKYRLKKSNSEIWTNELFSNKCIKQLNEKEFIKYIYNSNLNIFISKVTDELKLIEKSVIIKEWNDKYKNHICIKSKINLEDFENGYCYVAELWENVEEENFIVVSIYH